MSKIRTSHGGLLRITDMGKARRKVPGSLVGRELKQNEMSILPISPSGLLKSYDMYKKEKEILLVKHMRNISFLEARKNSFTSIARRADPFN